MAEQNGLLLDKLREYSKSDYYPFHMPGHKRQEKLGITSFPNPFTVDITEIDGFDNLHHAEGILKESMDRAAEIYKAGRTYYLVNGSTGGILSAVCGLTEPGGKIIMARNSHKSAYHAVLLQHLDPVYVYPDFAEGLGIQGGISPEKIEEAFRCQKEGKEGGPIQAVFITSPTYEGMVSDVEEIARIAHRHGVPLIVDEAHGAHFPFGGRFPASALDCKADAVIQSLHKTLPSLTQTAVLHLNGSLIDYLSVEHYLSVFQSSSPSYVFMASIENCICYMEREGRKRLEQFASSLDKLMEKSRSFRNIRLVDDTVCGSYHIKQRDASKIVVSTMKSSLTGIGAANLLRSRFHLEPEMVCDSYVLFMTSLMDTEDGFRRLSGALEYLDAAAGERTGLTDGVRTEGNIREENIREENVLTWLLAPQRVCTISDAWGKKQQFLPLEDAVGCVSSGFITVYPPGVPMIVPGELITGEAAVLIRKNKKFGLTVEGVTEDYRIAVTGRKQGNL